MGRAEGPRVLGRSREEAEGPRMLGRSQEKSGGLYVAGTGQRCQRPGEGAPKRVWSHTHTAPPGDWPRHGPEAIMTSSRGRNTLPYLPEVR